MDDKRYWVGNGGDWSDTAHWSTTSGGASGASVPTASQTVIFDANSFSSANQVVVVNSATRYCSSLIMTGVTNIPELRCTQLLITDGDITIPSGVRITGAGALQASGANNQKITINTIIECEFDITDEASALLYADLVCNKEVRVSTNSTFTLNGYNLTCKNLGVGGNSSLDSGSSTININSDTSALNLIQIEANNTADFSENTINVINTANPNIFPTDPDDGQALIFGTVNITNTTGTLSVNAENTFTNLNITTTSGGVTFNDNQKITNLTIAKSSNITIGTGGQEIQNMTIQSNATVAIEANNDIQTLTVGSGSTTTLTAGTIQTIENFISNGTSSSKATIASDTSSSKAYIKKLKGTIETDYLILTDIGFMGNSIWYVGENTTKTRSSGLGTNKPTGAGGVSDGYSLSFDGTGDYVDCGGDASLDTDGAYSVTAWIKMPTLQNGIIWGNDDNTTPRGVYLGILDATGEVYFEDSNVGQYFTGDSISANTWAHIAVCLGTPSGGTQNIKIYLNNSLIYNNTITETQAPPANFCIGRRNYPGFEGYWNGLIDGVRFYNTQLDATGVDNDYNNSPDETDLISEWLFDEGSGATTLDSKGSNDGTIYNATFSIDTPTIFADSVITPGLPDGSLNKRFIYRVFSPQGVMLGEFKDVISEFTFDESINTIGSAIKITLKKDAQDFDEGNTVNVNNKVEVWVQDDEAPEGDIKFQGYISSYKPLYDKGQIEIEITSYGELLNKTIIISPDNLDVDFSTNDIIDLNTVSPTLYLMDAFTTGAGVTNVSRITLMLSNSLNLNGTTCRLKLFTSLVNAQNVTSDLSIGTSGNITLSNINKTEYDFIFSPNITVSAATKYYWRLEFETIIGSGSLITYGGLSGGEYAFYYSSNWYNSTNKAYVKTYSGSEITKITFNQDISDTVKELIDSQKSQGGVIDYTPWSIETSGVSASITFNADVVAEGIKTLHKIAPDGWYYYIDQATNILYFKAKTAVSTIDHKFVLGKNINEVSAERYFDELVNVVYFIGGDTGGGSNLFKKYTDASSLATYGKRAIRINDGRVTISATADKIADTYLDRYANPLMRISGSIIDSAKTNLGYDIESITLGQNVALRGFVDNDTTALIWDIGNWDEKDWAKAIEAIDDQVLQVVKLNYSRNLLKLTLANLPRNIYRNLAENKRQVTILNTRDNPTSPS